MRGRFGPIGIVMVALIAIGIYDRIRNGASSLLIPIVLVAIVFLLYKFPPDRWFKGASASSSEKAKYRQAAMKSKRKNLASQREDKNAKRRTASFRVIEGSKKRDEEPPRYH